MRTNSGSAHTTEQCQCVCAAARQNGRNSIHSSCVAACPVPRLLPPSPHRRSRRRSAAAPVRHVSIATALAVCQHHTIGCGVASATRCRRVSRWRMQIQSPTVTPCLSSGAAWARYCCTTYCRPPHPLRVGANWMPQSTAAQTSFRLGIAGYNRLHAQSAQHQRTRCEQHFRLLRACRTLQGHCHSSATARSLQVVNTDLPLRCAKDCVLRDADGAVLCLAPWHTLHHPDTGPQRRVSHTHARSPPARQRLPLKFA